MKKFNNTVARVGGYPYNTDVFDHIQSGYSNAIAKIISKMLLPPDGNAMIMEGILVSSPTNNASVTSGTITFQGEVFEVDAHSIVGTGTLYWKIDVQAGAYMPVTFADATSKVPHEDRKLKMTYNLSEAAFNQSDLKRFYRGQGTIIFTAGKTAPVGYLKANGQTLNRASYPDLFDVCGIIHGKYFDPIDVNVSTNTISLINHGFTTGQQVQFDTLITLPAGLVVNTNYYFRAVTVNTFTVHNTSGDAGTGANPVDITTQGNGRSFVELFDKFRIPDARGYFLRGWADDSDFDLNRSIGSVQVDLVRLHSHQLIMRNGLAQSNPNLDMYGQSPRSLLNFGALTSVYDVPGDFGTNYNHTTNTGGDETRPTNKAYLVCIKY